MGLKYCQTPPPLPPPPSTLNDVFFLKLHIKVNESERKCFLDRA